MNNHILQHEYEVESEKFAYNNTIIKKSDAKEVLTILKNCPIDFTQQMLRLLMMISTGFRSNAARIMGSKMTRAKLEALRAPRNRGAKPDLVSERSIYVKSFKKAQEIIQKAEAKQENKPETQVVS